MFLDLFVLAVLAAVSFLGYRKGFARQIVAFVAIIAVYFLATPVSAIVRAVIFQERNITFPGIEVASLVIAGVMIFIGAWLLGRLFAAAITSLSERIEAIDEILGGVLGFIKGFLVVYLVLCGLVYAERPLSQKFSSLGEQMESSFMVAGARHWNILTTLRYPELSELRDAMLVANDPEKAERNEAMVRLLENEDFQSVSQDETLMQAAQERDYSTLLSDQRVLRLLADEDFQTVLTETDWDELLDD